MWTRKKLLLIAAPIYNQYPQMTMGKGHFVYSIISLQVQLQRRIYNHQVTTGRGECSPMARETRVQSQVESYQRLKKWYLMIPCLTLSIIKRYGLRVKWSNPGKGVVPSPTSWCSSYWKGSLRITLDYDCQLYFTYHNSSAGVYWWQLHFSILHPTPRGSFLGWHITHIQHLMAAMSDNTELPYYLLQ